MPPTPCVCNFFIYIEGIAVFPRNRYGREMLWLEPIYSFLRSLPAWAPLVGAVGCVMVLYLALLKYAKRPRFTNNIQITNLHFDDITLDPQIVNDIASRAKQIIRCHFRIRNLGALNMTVSNLFFPTLDVVLCNDLWGMNKRHMEELSFHEDSLSLKKLALIAPGKEISFSFCLLFSHTITLEHPFTLHLIVNHVGADTTPVTITTKGGFQKVAVA